MPVIDLMTAGRVAKRLGITVSRVQYVVRTRSHIIPPARAGRLYLFDSDTIAKIRHEITAMDARQSDRNAESCSK